MTIRKRTCENCGNVTGVRGRAFCGLAKRWVFTSKPPCKLKGWTGKKYDRTKKKKMDRFEFKLADQDMAAA